MTPRPGTPPALTFSADPWVTALTGRTINGYRLVECIGAGQFGYVFAVIKNGTGAEFAMKVHPANNDPFSAADFENEGLLLRKLNKCTGVINFVDSGDATIPMQVGALAQQIQVDYPLKYIVLTIASGTLEELTADPASRSLLPWRDRLGLWRSAVKGVHQMHLNSVAHRDLKSSNCLVVVQGTLSEIRLADLGRSKDFTRPHTAPPPVYLAGRGDRRFAPPEFLWLQGGYDATAFCNADLYGLGSLLVELVTGHPMTALAVGAWYDAVAEGERDLATGYQRDLAVLRPQFRRAFDEIGDQFPKAIRRDGTALISQLCDPVPQARQPIVRDRRHKPGHLDPGLLWLIRRADILARRLEVEKRRHRYKTQKSVKNWSAS